MIVLSGVLIVGLKKKLAIFFSSPNKLIDGRKEGWKEEGTDGRRDGRKEGRKEGRRDKR